VMPPIDYQLDGEPFLTDVTNALDDPHFDQVRDGHSSCKYKFMNAQNSYSMISGDFQYFFRATDSVDTMNDVDHLYANVGDEEQMYDLNDDPSEQNNLFEIEATMREQKYRQQIAEFQTIMREYIDIHCIAKTGAQCVKPDLMFGMQGGGYFDIECDPVDQVGCIGDDTCEAGRCVEAMQDILKPTDAPTRDPTLRPTFKPTPKPSHKPTAKPTTKPPTAPAHVPAPAHDPAPVHEAPAPENNPSPVTAPVRSPVASPVAPPVSSPATSRNSGSTWTGRSSGGRTSSGSTARSGGGGGRGGGGRGGRSSAMLFDGALSMDSESALSLKDATVKVSTLAALAVVALAVWLLKWCMVSRKQRENEVEMAYPTAFTVDY